MSRVFTTLSSKGQMVIPAVIRDQLGLEPGTRIAMRVEGERVILEPETLAAKLRALKELRGVTSGGPSMTDDLIEERRRDQARESEEEGW
jgi:AbrB family looped-hinge helix DNA binding protein